MEISDLIASGNIRFMEKTDRTKFPIEMPAPRHLDLNQIYNFEYVLLGENGQPQLKNSYSNRRLIEAPGIIYKTQSLTKIMGRDTFRLKLFSPN
ncbi:MAG: hypothetical protein AABW51_02155 [Nanoarchaeota archaeon]